MSTMFRAVDDNPVFRGTVAPYLVLDRDLIVRAVNPAYLRVTDRDREELLGRYVFDAFPDNPELPDPDGVRNVNASLQTVLRDNRPHTMPIQRYDIPARGDRQRFVLKYWSPVNSPLRDETGHAAGVLHHAEDVTPTWLTALRLRETVDISDAEEALPAGDHAAYARMLTHQGRAGEQMAAELEELRAALVSRVLIEQAKGVVMAWHDCDAQAAFVWLRHRARSSRIRLHDLCETIIAQRRP
jgi:hypothetical protein